MSGSPGRCTEHNVYISLDLHCTSGTVSACACRQRGIHQACSYTAWQGACSRPAKCHPVTASGMKCEKYDVSSVKRWRSNSSWTAACSTGLLVELFLVSVQPSSLCWEAKVTEVNLHDHRVHVLTHGESSVFIFNKGRVYNRWLLTRVPTLSCMQDLDRLGLFPIYGSVQKFSVRVMSLYFDGK